MKIVVTGSLGNIAKPLTTQLVQRGHAVTLISSNPAKERAIQLLGAEAAIGSLHKDEFLEQVFLDADAAFCMIPPDFSQPDQLAYYESTGKAYDRAIRNSGVKRIIHLSSYGAHLSSGAGLITGSYRVEQILNKLPNIDLTHIRPGFFYYNLISFIGMIKSLGFMGAVYGGEDRLALVSPQDIADVVAEELTTRNTISAVRYVASDDRTCDEIAQILGNAIGMPDLKWLTLTEDQVMSNLLATGMRKETASMLVELGMAIHGGKLREDFDKHSPLFGKVSLEIYADEFARIFHDK
ncbi:NmrA family NAD(P)-binding protein [Olivibacter sp. CPCC 100613]|uniref:NmrA family NAD(P)-binding protein n=1 Tax=Olivibacter sp. CPCC 100613 TaxID=3079931 RepID=UPI002FF7BC01